MIEKNVSIKEYTSDLQQVWNQFNKEAKNGLFLFDRNYMEYHSDRFQDNSLLFFYGNTLVGLLPANSVENKLYSHQGLTYGGFITNEKMKQHIMNECFIELIDYLKTHNFKSILYKTIPYIFHRVPAEEDRYSLFLCGAVTKKIEAATVINLKSLLKMSKGKKAQINRAKREGVIIRERTEESEIRQFWALEEHVLKKYHDRMPVHTAEEMVLLHKRFPDNIHLYTAELGDRMIAGAIVYDYFDTVHTQYLAVDEEGRRNGALDLLIYFLVESSKENKKWIDFGISTEDAGKTLNLGLISQKENFGGRTVVYKTYEVIIDERYQSIF